MANEELSAWLYQQCLNSAELRDSHFDYTNTYHFWAGFHIAVLLCYKAIEDGISSAETYFSSALVGDYA